MRLTSFSVSNFRSITTAKKVPVTEYSVLVGANNEGKSNILHALALGMEVIEDFKNSVRRDKLGRIISISSQFSALRSPYEWSQDFPMSKQKRVGTSDYSEILFEFTLSEAEIEAFQSEIGSKLNGNLPIAVQLKRNDVALTIPKQGPGGTALNRKTNKVADFVSRHINFEYIPAVRTSESAQDVISALVSKELARLEADDEYKAALDKITELQEPLLRSISRSISSTISSFLPSVQSVEISMGREARMRALRRSLRIEVDDGNKTPLERKGDGVKSLVALALMRHQSDKSAASGASIVAIEEPEAHLHPQAIHELRDVLIRLSEKNQIIITSHSPLFVNPIKLESTIIVQGSKAAVAKDIAEVREVLGVRLSDNLQSARLVAIMEGDDDIIIMDALLRKGYPDLVRAIECGDLVFDALGGATNLSYKVRTYRSSATLVQCFLDNDKAGVESAKRALGDNIIREADYNLIKVPGMSESEIEDILDSRYYKDKFFEEFAVDPTIKPPGSNGKKWSSAMRRKFEAHGKLWDDTTKMRVKLWLANFAKSHIQNIVVANRVAPVDAFAKSLIQKLERR